MNSLNFWPPNSLPTHLFSSSIRKLCSFESQSFCLCSGPSLQQHQICFFWPTHFRFKIFEVGTFRWSMCPSVLIPTYSVILFFCAIFLAYWVFEEIPRPISIDIKVKTIFSVFFYWVNYWHNWEATSWEYGGAVLQDDLSKCLVTSDGQPLSVSLMGWQRLFLKKWNIDNDHGRGNRKPFQYENDTLLPKTYPT